MKMKWCKVDENGNKAKRNCNSFEPHNYVTDDKLYIIINNSFHERKNCWVLCYYNGEEIKKFDTLKQAKLFAENM